ncbi:MULTISPECIES: hypothetical protein [unclassified Pseudomonas]|uniref:hypothetical protein n=1 Tax=unclassified Pseudomonas TaxID=196821 RepID=UPI001314BAB6|nr:MULTISPECIES: hypothetical protein [unclassified Pseudomonas]MDW3715348.1 hypothetical protein [Pseudomonas sp. 2023EL-01195]
MKLFIQLFVFFGVLVLVAPKLGWTLLVGAGLLSFVVLFFAFLFRLAGVGNPRQ